MPAPYRALLIVTLALILSACMSRPASEPALVVFPAPAEQEVIITLGTAEQASAPALYVDRDGVTAAWISADERDTYHTVRRFTWGDNYLTEAERLSILTQFPQVQRFHRGADGLAQLLWLDADPNDPYDGLRLWSVLIDNSPSATRGAFTSADRPIAHLATLPNADGTLWAFYSTLPVGEPTLRAGYFDHIGRPREDAVLVYNADWPSAVSLPGGTIRLFWHRGESLIGADLDAENQRLIDGTERALIPLPELAPGDLFEAVQAVRTVHDVYLFWNISRADGAAETWFSVSPLDSDSWITPRPLTYAGFSLRWGTAAQSDTPPETLRVFGQIGAELGLLTLDGADVVDYVSVVPLPAPGLIGLPALHEAGGRTILAWAQPSAASMANMNLLVLER